MTPRRRSIDDERPWWSQMTFKEWVPTAALMVSLLGNYGIFSRSQEKTEQRLIRVEEKQVEGRKINDDRFQQIEQNMRDAARANAETNKETRDAINRLGDKLDRRSDGRNRP